jgi:hypothetical protein
LKLGKKKIQKIFFLELGFSMMEGLFDNAERRLDPSQFVHKHVLDLHNMPLMTRELAQRMAVAVVSSMHKHDCVCGCCITISIFAIDLVQKMFDTILGRQLCGNLDPISFSTTSFPLLWRTNLSHSLRLCCQGL